MSERSFLDTNILIYTDDHANPDKQRVALDLVDRAFAQRSGVVSTQVLQEYFAAATRNLGVDATLARRKVELFARLDTVQVSVELVLSGIDLHRLHAISFWDALIVRAALDAGCTVLLSEDMQAGQRLAGLRIANPFAQ
jgi:predicted nucleic acid-binding protein